MMRPFNSFKKHTRQPIIVNLKNGGNKMNPGDTLELTITLAECISPFTVKIIVDKKIQTKDSILVLPKKMIRLMRSVQKLLY